MTILATVPAVGENLQDSPTIQLPRIAGTCDIPWCTRHYGPDVSDPNTTFHVGADKTVDLHTTEVYDDGETVTRTSTARVHLCEITTDVGGESFRGQTVIYLDDLQDTPTCPEDALRLADVIASRARLAIAARDGAR